MITEARKTCFQHNFNVSCIPDLKGNRIHEALSKEVKNTPQSELSQQLSGWVH